MPLFSKKGRLKTGLQKLRLFRGEMPDLRWPSSTPGKVPLAARGELGRLEQKLKQLERGELPLCPWLDQLSRAAAAKRETALNGQAATSDDLFVVVHLPTYPCAVLYCPGHLAAAQGLPRPGGPQLEGPQSDTPFENVPDPEVARAAAGLENNPCELKALKLSQAMGLGMHRDARPNKVDQKVIRQALSKPPSRELSLHERTTLSKFRHYLSGLRVEHRQYSTIVPFVRCVDWSVEAEAQAAIADMQDWHQVDVTDALYLLNGTIMHPAVRAFAVDVLRAHLTDAALPDVLVQLVQCVHFDARDGPSPLSDFLVDVCHRNTSLAIALHWTLIVEETGAASRLARMQERLYARLRAENEAGMAAIHGQLKLRALLDSCRRELGSVSGKQAKEDLLRRDISEDGKLADLLHLDVPSPQDPTLMLRAVVPESCKVFKSARAPVLLHFAATSTASAASAEGSPPPRRAQDAIVPMLFKHGDDVRQDQFVCQLVSVMDRLLKRERIDLKLTPYWVLPMSPNSGLLEFVPSTTLQQLTLMRGMEGKGILKFLVERSRGGASGAPTGESNAELRAAVSPQIFDNFIRSNAGYAIVSYLLDMGDRHLENLLLKDDGRLFHIDFGYVLGMRDPKQWAKVPVPVKSSIIDAMGGVESPHYEHFKKLVCEGFLQLRGKARELLTLLSCMSDSSVDCFKSSSEQQKTFVFANKQFEDRLLLDVDDEMARDRIFQLIDQSITNVMAGIADGLHRVAATLRH